MARIVGLNAIFFLLPFAVYAGWLMIVRRPVGAAASWSMKTVVALAAGGLLLATLALIFFIHFTAAPPGAEYRPATIGKDGRIVPGTLE